MLYGAPRGVCYEKRLAFFGAHSQANESAQRVNEAGRKAGSGSGMRERWFGTKFEEECERACGDDLAGVSPGEGGRGPSSRFHRCGNHAPVDVSSTSTS